MRTLAPVKAVVMGSSAGGFETLKHILAELPETFSLPILIAQHLHPTDAGRFADHLNSICPLDVITPDDKAPIESGVVHVAPANYHMLVGEEGTIALSVDQRVMWSRPSIDVLFQSAAAHWGSDLMAILLTGANRDGTDGLMNVRRTGGTTIAQDPETAKSSAMPLYAIDAGCVQKILTPDEIARRLGALSANTFPEHVQSKANLKEESL